jgi:hypothetical protein
MNYSMKLMMMVVIGIVAFLSSTNAFSITKMPTSSRVSTLKQLPVNTRSPVRSGDMKMAMIPALAAMAPLSKLVLGLPVMYMLFSANEYVTHRYYQHNEIGKMFFYKTLRKFGLFPKIDGGGTKAFASTDTQTTALELQSITCTTTLSRTRGAPR